MTSLLSNPSNAFATVGHRSTKQPKAPPELTDEERTRRRCARIRSVPCVYLKCPPERKRNEKFAIAALLGLDHHTHRLEEVLGMVNLHCPNLFRNPAAVEELFLHGTTAGIEHVIMRMYTRIAWNSHLAVLGLQRSPEIYRFLPSSVQVKADVVEELLTHCSSGANILGRFAPRDFLSENEDLILGVLGKGFRSADIPLEMRRNKEFVVKALAETSCILSFCPFEMVSDKDVLLAAAGQKHILNAMAFLENTLNRFPGNPTKVLVPFAEEVKMKLDNHAAFRMLLKGITFAGRARSSNPLNLLHCGDETSAALKRDIADFLGAPTQKSEYRALKSAWDNSVARYYTANVKPKANKANIDSDDLRRLEERKISQQQRMSRQLMMVVHRDIVATGRADDHQHRDYRRLMHQVHIAEDIGERDMDDSDSQFEQENEAMDIDLDQMAEEDLMRY